MSREGRFATGAKWRKISDRGVLLADGQEVQGRAVVLAGGAWTPELARSVGLKLPMQAGKGYSMTLKEPVQLPELCSLLGEAKVAVTPMGSSLRIAGTLEVCGDDLRIRERRVQGIIKAVCRVFPQFESEHFEGVERWAGLRPCSPDGLPYVGKVPGRNHVLVATGHAMLGLSLGPITGRLVSQLLNGEEPEIPVGQLAADRFA